MAWHPSQHSNSRESDSRITLGFDPNGDFFGEIGAGYGIGAAVSFDPNGQPIAADCDQGDDGTVGVSLLADAGFGAGPAGAGYSGSASGVLNLPACGCVSAGPSVSLSPSDLADSMGRVRYGGVASATANFTFFAGNGGR